MPGSRWEAREKQQNRIHAFDRTISQVNGGFAVVIPLRKEDPSFVSQIEKSPRKLTKFWLTSFLGSSECCVQYRAFLRIEPRAPLPGEMILNTRHINTEGPTRSRSTYILHQIEIGETGLYNAQTLDPVLLSFGQPAEDLASRCWTRRQAFHV